jgi:RNA-directed DNA polymerase
MRRIADVWDTISSFQNLARAAKRAARGKRRVRGVAAFLARLEPEVLALQRELREGRYRPGPSASFTIHDPKTREISAAPFGDRVVHHALIDPLEPMLDRRLIANSHACRRGKGQHRAVRCAQRLLRRHAFFLKLDVKSFFPSLRHDVVMATIGRIVGDRAALALFEVIVRAGGENGVGLPIGNLTSQWLANLVLGGLDRFVLGALRIPGYVRYMDDFVLFADDRAALRDAQVAIAGWLGAHALRLKDTATILAPAHAGLPFCGFAIHRGTLRIRPANLRRCRARIRHREWQYREGLLSEERLAASVGAGIEHLRQGCTLALRRTWLGRGVMGADPQLRQPREPGRQLRQLRLERALRQPQQELADEPQ